MSGCEHYQAFSSEPDGRRKLAALQRAIRTTSVQPARALDEPVTLRPPRPLPAFACLECAVGRITATHAVAHQAASGHALALDTKRLEVFCCICRDYVFDRAVDTAVSAARCSATAQLAGGNLPDRQPVRPPSPPPPPTDSGYGHEHVSSVQMAASAISGIEGAAIMPSAVPADAADSLPQGLRGLNNLGNTCFMNSVLQAVLHAPMLRQFFLAEGHPAGGCHRAAGAQPCLSCELDSLFGAMYSSGRIPVSPVAFLRTWWHMAGGHLEGYQQQDAHEFYLNALSGLSVSLSTPPPSEEGAEEVQSQAWGSSVGGVPVLTNGFSAPSSPPHHPQPAMEPFGSPSSPVLLPAAGVPSAGGHAFLQDMLSAAAHQFLQSSPGLLPDQPAVQPSTEPAVAPPAASQSFASSICTDDGEADGLVQRVFGGLLRSDVTCRACGHTSTAFDPFLDLSLDLPPAPTLPQVWQRSSGTKPRPVASAPQAAARPPRPPQQPSALHQPPDAFDATGSVPHLRGAISGYPGGRRSSPEPELTDAGTRSGSASGTTCSPSVELDLSRPQTPCSSGGSQSMYRDASSVSPRTSEASSVNEETLGDAPTSVSAADGTVEPGPSPQSPPLPRAVTGLRGPKVKGAAARARKGQHRRTRCGDCHHCRNPNLKKACLNPRQGSPSAVVMQQLAAAEMAMPTASAASDPGPAPQLLDAANGAEDGVLEASGTTDGGGIEQTGNGCTSTASAGNGSMRKAAGSAAAAQHRAGGGPVSKAATAAATGGTSLVGCLTRFVRPEKLGPCDHWQCARCRARQRAVKQMSIAQLPPVLAMHVKRFEAGGTHSQAPRKLATPVSFPLNAPLDMRPYLSSSVLARRCGLRLHNGQQDAADEQQDAADSAGDAAAGGVAEGDAAPAAQYRAYAVVCHHGNMQGGHYTAYIRASGQWYLCDDGWVGVVPAPQVRQSQAFQLFYARADLV